MNSLLSVKVPDSVLGDFKTSTNCHRYKCFKKKSPDYTHTHKMTSGM
jgi:hypothetical protein